MTGEDKQSEESIEAAAERQSKCIENGKAGDSCWISRVYEWPWISGSKKKPWLPGKPDYESDRQRLVEYAIARLAADHAEREERERPIDEGWLRSLGFVRKQHFAVLPMELSGYKTQVNVNVERGYVSIGQMDERESQMEMVAIRKMTRGQLLDLLAALGVERKGGG